MSVRDPRAPLGRRATGPPSPSARRRRILLACGIAAAVLYGVGNDVVAVLLYPGYDPLSQAISELTSRGAPTRPPLVVMGFVYDALIVAFGIGVWQSARGRFSLRVVGAALIAHALVGPLWLPFPMSARGQFTQTSTFTDTMHLVLGGATILIMLLMIGFGAAAFGSGFRLYSALTVAAVLGFGAWMSIYVPLVPAGQPTPWMGLAERLMIWSWLAWMTVLAALLLRTTADGTTPGGRSAE